MARIFLVIAVLALSSPVLAEADLQFGMLSFQAPKDSRVNGTRFSVLYNENESVRGLDLGFFSVSRTARFSGLALVFGISVVDREMADGASLSFVNFHSGSDSGFDGAFINRLGSLNAGAVVGFVNVADGNTNFGLGGLNLSSSSDIQVGFINYAKKIDSFQFGFINIAENGIFPVLPFFNVPRR